jgi:hypothetical protein
MKQYALSIRQPWAWMIVHGWKDIENRDWPTRYRGPLWIHASRGMTKAEYDEARAVAVDAGCDLGAYHFPEPEQLERGGIIGRVALVGCVTYSDSPWFFGDFGFVLKDPQVVPFRPLRGQLGIFPVEGVRG